MTVDLGVGQGEQLSVGGMQEGAAAGAGGSLDLQVTSNSYAVL